MQVYENHNMWHIQFSLGMNQLMMMVMMMMMMMMMMHDA